MKKTNAMRILDQMKLDYDVLTYESKDGAIDGLAVAEKVNRPPEQVYKTLVLAGASKQYYVCMIPVTAHLSLKKVAKCVGEKKVEMIPVKDIMKVSGYIRGGCSPIGMKKQYPTIIHENLLSHEYIVYSAGKIGMQIEMKPSGLIDLIHATVEDIVE